ncbi:GDSL esterase/lipase EXL3-like protein [Carex littledalei]|uniref:GDSL esterase/lipase EXL3-like protein n=1 Tax=Carex littledalei TaxID=544730 RepID=A0A833RFQ6_9POAL|nr:GDSL esterase/lipase EXL3-like protein [Carex littledalei]
MAYSFNQTKPLVPAVIVFGDSIVDPGNNNDLKTPIICNFPPYGQNFYGHKATGRFSNGKIPTDFIASGLGVKDLLPPYVGYPLTPQDILTGVSFASGATGFDPLTPVIVNVIPMMDQLKLFAEYKEKLKAIAGEQKAAKILSEALYVICVGTDDVANTYFTTPFRVIDYDIPSYVNLLVSHAGTFIKQLHAMGARKIGYVGLPPIGCVPSQRTVGGGLERNCEPKRNYAAQLYNYKIQGEIDNILKETGRKDTKITYIDIYNILLDIIQRPGFYGFEEATKGCCGTGLIEVTKLCNSKTAKTCSDVTKYVFWDSFHPTEKAYKAIVNNIFDNYLSVLI